MLKLFTHGGIFHADDVFAFVVLRMYFGEVTLTRGFDVPSDFEGIVFDIGNGKYDHHESADKKERRKDKGNIPYAAFGKIWRDYGPKMFSRFVVNTIDSQLCKPLDFCDNNGGTDTISLAVGAFNPIPGSGDSADTAFMDAAEFAQGILERAIRRAQATENQTTVVRSWYKAHMQCGGGPIMIMPEYLPFTKALQGTSVLFVVYPSNRGGYNAQVVGNPPEVLFPAEWGGKTGKELASIAGISNLAFCHAGRHLVSGKTERACISAACKAIENL